VGQVRVRWESLFVMAAGARRVKEDQFEGSVFPAVELQELCLAQESGG
jgi:hypothetical protein